MNNYAQYGNFKLKKLKSNRSYLDQIYWVILYLKCSWVLVKSSKPKHTIRKSTESKNTNRI